MNGIDLSSKTAVVCGSTQGIGYAIAQLFSELNARVILVARNEDKLSQVVSSLKNQQLMHQYFVADFSNTDDIVRLSLSLNNLPVDILINNTGGPAAGPVTSATTEQFIAAFNAHLIANHTISQAVITKMKEQRFGRIINIISTSVKQPIANLGVSNTIRAAVANWAKTLASEVGRFNITVNNILPGATNTSRLNTIIENNAAKKGLSPSEAGEEMMNEIPMHRFADPTEIAWAAAFLASDKASYITGINLPVDGGRTSSL